ncbi:MAG: hypothetical protein HND48_00310 [Chloroflexi bacterium]|nr:hypothetical protein [Chloroflexota bacterium]
MRTPRFLLICALVLSSAVMGACNLTQQEERLPTATPTTLVSTKPIVTIISPASGVEHRVNTGCWSRPTCATRSASTACR